MPELASNAAAGFDPHNIVAQVFSRSRSHLDGVSNGGVTSHPEWEHATHAVQSAVNWVLRYNLGDASHLRPQSGAGLEETVQRTQRSFRISDPDIQAKLYEDVCQRFPDAVFDTRAWNDPKHPLVKTYGDYIDDGRGSLHVAIFEFVPGTTDRISAIICGLEPKPPLRGEGEPHPIPFAVGRRGIPMAVAA